MSDTQVRSNKPAVHLVLTILGMAGVAGLFLPFVYGVSPVAAAFHEHMWLLALPSFLAPLAIAASVRWIMSGSFSRLERAIAYLLSTAMVAMLLVIYADSENWPTGLQEWISFVAAPAVWFLGAYFLFRNSRNPASRAFNPVLALQTAYIANGLLCLLAFYGEWQVGAYFVLVTASVFALQIILVSARQARLGPEAQA